MALLAFSVVACRKEKIVTLPDTGTGQPVASYENTINVTVDQTRRGYTISPTFEGLSFETAILTQNPEYLNPNNAVFVQLFKNLGPGLLRIGGGTSDEINWSGGPRSMSTASSVLTTSDIDRLSAFSKAIGWPVLFGLNLAAYQVSASANEAQYVNNSLGSNLYAFQFGNEPDYFTANGLRNTDYLINDYLTDWDAYYKAIKQIAPQASYAGPDVVNGMDWINEFAANENEKVKLIDGHYYLTGPATDPSITYKDILVQDNSLPVYLDGIKSASSQYNLPFRITECNNVWGGGKAGVSDVFASTLWALDFMWTAAGHDAQGINFHDGEGIVYSPVSMSAGKAVVHPEYYAMLAFKYAGAGGTIIPVDIAATNYVCSAYACTNPGGGYSITLINKEETKNISFNIQLSNSVGTIQIFRLTAPALTATSNVTFAGSAVNADGTFTPGKPEQYTINQKKFTVNMAAGSAAVITLN